MDGVIQIILVLKKIQLYIIKKVALNGLNIHIIGIKLNKNAQHVHPLVQVVIIQLLQMDQIVQQQKIILHIY